MEHIHYKVAGLSFLIRTNMPEQISFLLPSYSLFHDTGECENPIFEFTITKEEQVLYGQEVYRFVWEGAGYIIYRGEKGYTFRIFPASSDRSYLMRTDAAFTNAVVCMDGYDRTDGFVLNNCLMMMYAFSAASYNALMVHASVIRNDNKGYLFLGKSGTGKSTHSNLWLKHIPGSDLLNDDNPIVRITGSEVIVSGSPWSGKTACYRDLQVSVGAIVRLNQASANNIEKCKPSQSFAVFLASCSAMKWDKRIYDNICDTVSKVAETVPFYVLGCLPDAEASVLCYQTVTHE